MKNGRIEAAVDVLQIAFHSPDCLQLFSFSFADSRPCTELKPLTKLKPFRIGQGFCSSSVSKFFNCFDVDFDVICIDVHVTVLQFDVISFKCCYLF